MTRSIPSVVEALIAVDDGPDRPIRRNYWPPGPLIYVGGHQMTHDTLPPPSAPPTQRAIDLAPPTERACPVDAR
jgi:hypothetical protein